MKKALLILPSFCLILTLLLPCGALLCALFDCSFKLCNYTAFAIATALAALADAVLATVFINARSSWAEYALRILVLLFSAVNPLFYLTRCCNMAVAVCMLLSFGCACYAAVMRTKSLVLKGLSLAFGVLTPVPVCLFLLFILTLGNLGENSVVRSVDSPDGSYQAQIVESSQGALGGDTLVRIKSQKGDFDLFLFKISKNPQIVYKGAWWEFETMELYWKNEQCLVINEKEYSLK